VLEKLTILGGGGWFPANGRHTACALLRNGDGAVLIDAGTGAGRLVEAPDLLDGVRTLDILLTHFHLDHISGLAYLPALALTTETRLWGPGKLLYGIATHALLEQFSHEPFHPIPLEDQNIDVRDVASGTFELAGMSIESRRQDRHSAPTLAYRFGDSLTWITDTAYDPEAARFAAGCQIVAHEAWFTTDAPRTPDVHSSAAQAAEIAQRAEAERLLLIHLPPFEHDVTALALEAQATMPEALLAEDGRDVAPTLA
jgi:ribonuclease BN (tRNA processing enzyme)